MLSLSIIPAQCSVPPTTPMLAPPNRLCCHSTMAVRSSCVQWTTATAPACPLCLDTMATLPTHAHPLSLGRRSFRTQCPPQLPLCPSQCRTSQCGATGLALHRAIGTPTSTASMENLLLNTMSPVNHFFPHSLFLSLASFPFAFSLFILSSCKTTITFRWHFVSFYISQGKACGLPSHISSFSSLLKSLSATVRSFEKREFVVVLLKLKTGHG